MFRVVWMSLSLLAAGAAAAQDSGFTRLFDGKAMPDFVLVGTPAETYKVQDGAIVATGKGNGYFATKKSYANYVLKFDWRYARPAALTRDEDFDGTSGLLVHITGEHKVWPRAVQVQLYNRDAGSIFGVGGVKTRGTRDSVAQATAVNRVGEWNTQEVTCADGKITCRINNVIVSEATNSEVKEGAIGWQYKGAEIHFRNLQIKELK